PAASAADTTTPKLRARRHKPLLLSLIVLSILALVGYGAYYAWTSLAQTEDERYQLAHEQFLDKQYGKAEKSFAFLANAYPDSERIKEYQGYERLSQALRPAFEPGRDPKEAMEAIDQVLQDASLEPLITQSPGPIREAFDQIIRNHAAEAQ